MTRQLIAWLIAALTGFWLLAAGLGAFVMREEFDEIFDGSLQETAQRLLPLMVDDLAKRIGSPETRRLDEQALENEEEYLVYQVRDQSGAVVLRSRDAPAAPFSAPLVNGFFQDRTYRFYSAANTEGTLFIQVADALANRQEAVTEGATALLIPLAVLIPVSAGLIMIIVRRALRPVADLRQAIERKDGGNMAPIPLTGLPQELASIGRSVNLLLGRLEAAFEAERNLAALQLERVVAEEFAPPAGKRGDIGRVVASDRLELVDGRNDAGRDPMLLARHLEQHLQEVDRGAVAVRERLHLRDARQLVLGDRHRPANGGEDVLSRPRALEALRNGAQATESLGSRRVLLGDLVDRVILDDAAAWHVARLRLALAPGGKLHENGQLQRLLDPHLQPLPGVLGLHLIGFDRGEDVHLLGHPLAAPLALQLFAEREIDVAQMRHVGEGIGELVFAERPVAPVGEARRLVDRMAGDAPDQLVIGDRFAEAAHHGRDLRIEDRMRKDAAEMPDDLDVLARGVEHLHHALVGHQREEGREVQPRRFRVDDHRFVAAGDLDDAELRPVGRLPHELGIDGDEGVAGEA